MLTNIILIILKTSNESEDDGHEVHMLIPIREENYKLADKNEEVQLNVRYFMPKTLMSPSLVSVHALPIEHDKIYLDIANDLELMDELRAEKFDVGITEAFLYAGYSLAIFHLLQIPATIATLSQAMAPCHLYLLGVLSKIKTGMHSDYIGLQTMNFRPTGEDRLELLNFKSREVREEQLKLRRETVWHHYVKQTMELINDLINQDVDYQKLAEEKYGLNTFPSWDEMFRSTRFFFLNSLPEKELLAHPKTMAFVSHCGMNSVMESTFYGVPMVCMPFFGDQYYNAELLAFQNIGLVIETKNDKQTIQKELNLALSTALGLMKSSEEHFDLDKLKSVSVGIRQKNITKTISDAMKTIENEINEKKRQ
uniref:glucuronosyltransferase n=1 Tax=Globodera pallida TaxID=36090 RepID=A0A183C3A9_GLOPA